MWAEIGWAVVVVAIGVWIQHFDQGSEGAREKSIGQRCVSLLMPRKWV